MNRVVREIIELHTPDVEDTYQLYLDGAGEIYTTGGIIFVFGSSETGVEITIKE